MHLLKPNPCFIAWSKQLANEDKPKLMRFKQDGDSFTWNGKPLKLVN